MKERSFEILLVIVSAIGIIILFTILFQGPVIILRRIVAFFTGGF